MRTVLSLSFVAAVLTACTVETDKMNNKDATRAYVGPSFCAKGQQCEPLWFSLANGTEASLNASGDERSTLERQTCERKYNEREQAKETRLTDCTNEEWQKCRSDLFATPCAGAMTVEEFDRTAGLPAIPASCTECE